MITEIVYFCESCGKQNGLLEFSYCPDCGKEICRWCGVTIQDKIRCAKCASGYNSFWKPDVR